MPVARNHMSTELLTVEPTLALTEVAKRMVAKDVGAVLVFDETGLCARSPTASTRRTRSSATA